MAGRVGREWLADAACWPIIGRWQLALQHDCRGLHSGCIHPLPQRPLPLRYWPSLSHPLVHCSPPAPPPQNVDQVLVATRSSTLYLMTLQGQVRAAMPADLLPLIHGAVCKASMRQVCFAALRLPFSTLGPARFGPATQTKLIPRQQFPTTFPLPLWHRRW